MAGGRRAAGYRLAYTPQTGTAMATPDLVEVVSMCAEEAGIHIVMLKLAQNQSLIQTEQFEGSLFCLLCQD